MTGHRAIEVHPRTAHAGLLEHQALDLHLVVHGPPDTTVATSSPAVLEPRHARLEHQVQQDRGTADREDDHQPQHGERDRVADQPDLLAVAHLMRDGALGLLQVGARRVLALAQAGGGVFDCGALQVRRADAEPAGDFGLPLAVRDVRHLVELLDVL